MTKITSNNWKNYGEAACDAATIGILAGWIAQDSAGTPFLKKGLPTDKFVRNLDEIFTKRNLSEYIKEKQNFKNFEDTKEYFNKLINLLWDKETKRFRNFLKGKEIECIEIMGVAHVIKRKWATKIGIVAALIALPIIYFSAYREKNSTPDTDSKKS